MKRFWMTPLVACLAALGCVPADTDGTNSSDNTSDNTNTTDTNNNTGDSTSDDSASALSLRGTLIGQSAAKRGPRAADADPDSGYTVVAQSTATMETYRGTTDDQGDFLVDLPDDEAGNTFMVAIIDENGQPVSTVVFDGSGDTGYTGLSMSESATLGTIELPDDPSATPVMPGVNATTGSMIDPTVFARLNDDGCPVGVGNNGKGSASQGVNSASGNQILDGDQDGLPDFIDADNNGNGIVDDWDSNGGDAAPNDGVRLNFFMNLKIDEPDTDVYYGSDLAAIDDSLKEQTIITMEVLEEPGAPKHITGVALVESPGPSYIPLMTTSIGPNSFALWSSIGYAFDDAGDRFQRFVIPHDHLNAGDTFTVEVTFEDGSTKQYSRMVNFVFTNIPRLRNWGQGGGALGAFAGGVIQVDNTQDLDLEFQPPTDDTGNYLENLDYSFEVFYYDGSNQQINNIDVTATWPTPPTGYSGNRTVFSVSAASLSLSVDDTYTVTLPSSIFVDSVETSTGTVAVSEYKIDIAPQSNGNNSAIMLHFERQ
ncbi:MAG: hypothetical protein JNG88_08875 [Phycisphaerales bacterium]|nr:hypothetical protein [Phycisphaerales bacterium]